MTQLWQDPEYRKRMLKKLRSKGLRDDRWLRAVRRGIAVRTYRQRLEREANHEN
jgi:hypothetical protein